jgi:ACS family sodium-dependent inorganic phosphate cotransporter
MNGIAAGTVIGLAVSGGLVARYDWPAPFYAFGVVGIGLAAAWFATVADDPATDPRIGADERALLALHCAPRDAAAPVPWGELLPRAPLWAIVAAHFASTWTLYLLLSWLPSYFREAQGVALASAGLYSAGPWLAMLAVTTAAGQLSDALIRRGVPVTRVRQLMQCGGLVASGLLLLAARDVHSALGAFAILCAATGALGTVWLGYAPGIIDVAPRHAALVSGISNSIAQLPGLIGVGLTGWLLDVTGTYAAAFALTAVVSAGGALAFGLWFRARPLVG